MLLMALLLRLLRSTELIYMNLVISGTTDYSLLPYQQRMPQLFPLLLVPQAAGAGEGTDAVNINGSLGDPHYPAGVQ